MLGKYKYLLKNMGLMTISSFASKILSFLLVPLYTTVLTTQEYGTYDLYTTTAFLLIPLLSACISDAVLRFTLDKEKSPEDVLSIGMLFYLRACICVLVLVAINYMFGIIDIFNEYPIFFLLYYCLCLLSDILTQFARGLEKIFDVAVSGILSSVTTISLNIVLLIVFPLGIKGYFIANSSAFGITALYLIFRLRIWKYLKCHISKCLKKEMVTYSLPLILNQIGWWINNVSDRYIVTWLCGTAANGIYSVAYKIPSLLSVFQTIFNQAWTLSAVKELDEEGSQFYTSIYKLYNCGMVLVCSILIAGDKIIAHVLFANDFYTAWEYAPYLMLSVVFGSLSGLLGGIFTAAKDSKIIARTTATGAGVNTILNIVFVYFVGPVGAAIATLISYVLVWGVRLRAAKKLVSININLKRDIISYIILIIQSICLSVNKRSFMYIFEMITFIVLLFIYSNDLKAVIRKLRKKIGK
ncbi:polysaccharide biosynthesis protein [Lachnoclostridium sp. An169]|uniref:lipopolysaccharide biosynthesis protein n=1 Tax=Lachnoclostridium sp. An169 TaxID=1965569 RepID=UPI000B3681A6|nr:oligosaccharide flippase family protein [Lachnoclostridium sp. An169]OUP80848.1 polysaccharide biosynthesis protein [Lachnoclostridium sp. An169]